VVVGRAATHLLRRGPSGETGTVRESAFVALWLGIEVACYFLLSPYPAARRLPAVIVIATLLVGRLAALAAIDGWRVWGPRLVVLQLMLAGLFWAVDFVEAAGEKMALARAAEWIGAHDPTPRGTTWFAGHWGFQYYAEKAGMRPIVSRRFAARSLVKAGDWLVMPDRRIHQQEIALDPASVEPRQEVQATDALPLRTLPGFYIGPAPLERLAGPRVRVIIYAVRHDFVP